MIISAIRCDFHGCEEATLNAKGWVFLREGAVVKRLKNSTRQYCSMDHALTSLDILRDAIRDSIEASLKDAAEKSQ